MSELSYAPDTRLQPPRLGARERTHLTMRGIECELRGSWGLAADTRSFLRLASDALAYRADRLPGVGGRGRPRRIRFKDGVVLTYRPNRGDVRAIAETWMAKAYELPFSLRARNLLDLGAHIGVASVWLARRYRASTVVAAEPVPANALLARRNLERNGIASHIVPAAVGPRAETGHFALSANSTLGRLAENGMEVPVVTVQSLLGRFPADERIGLVKMDIEGAEQDVFSGDVGWLSRVDCLILELHADRVDWRGIIALLEEFGFIHSALGEGNHYMGLTDRMAGFHRA